MTAHVRTITKPAGINGWVMGNRKCKVRDITYDTGTYTTGGDTVTAASLGLKRIDVVLMGTQIMTGGTSGASGNPIGVTYASDGTSVTFQVYESAATGLSLLEKTNTEAEVANATYRVLFIGW